MKAERCITQSESGQSAQLWASLGFCGIIIVCDLVAQKNEVGYKPDSLSLLEPRGGKKEQPHRLSADLQRYACVCTYTYIHRHNKEM